MTRELGVLEDSANVARLLEDRAKRKSNVKKRASSGATNSIQTGLGAFFTSKTNKQDAARESGVNSTTTKLPISFGKQSSVDSSDPQVGSSVIDLCEASSDDQE